MEAPIDLNPNDLNLIKNFLMLREKAEDIFEGEPEHLVVAVVMSMLADLITMSEDQEKSFEVFVKSLKKSVEVSKLERTYVEKMENLKNGK